MKRQEQILLHEDNELSEILGMGIISRTQIQAWPLSFVERIKLSDNTSRIYKSFYNLPTETEFYRRVQSKHIPQVFYNNSDGDNHWLLLEDVEGQHPANLDGEQTLNLVHRTRKIINEIGSAEPYRFDLSESGYDDFISTTIELLQKLRRETKLKKADEAVINRIKEMLSSQIVLKTIHGQCVLLHGDLIYKNIIIRPDDSIVIIDWQNIFFGPENIDAYNLISNPLIALPIAGIGPEILRLSLVIRWFAECIDRWLPWPDFYDGKIAKLEEQMRHVVENNGYSGMEDDYYQR